MEVQLKTDAERRRLASMRAKPPCSLLRIAYAATLTLPEVGTDAMVLRICEAMA
jgi:hypothetical protein